MTANAHELLAAFDALPPTDKQQVVAEILRRSGNEQSDQTDHPDRVESGKQSRAFKPIKISGPPLSEDIIRDRQARG